MSENFPQSKINKAAFNIVSNEAVQPPPTIDEIEAFIDALPKGDVHDHELDAEGRAWLVETLSRLGMLTKPIDEARRRRLVEATRKLIDNGQAEQFLESRELIYRYLSFKNARKIGAVYTPSPVYFDPNKITAAATFSSWLGRAPRGQEIVQDPQTGQERTSLEAIYDYATRDSEFPPVDITVYLSRSGTNPIVRTANDHRAAAAKLRNEPLGATTVRFYELPNE